MTDLSTHQEGRLTGRTPQVSENIFNGSERKIIRWFRVVA
jgi:hypothetical protein